MARLFFAAWPDPRAAERLGELAREIARLSRGKPVPDDKIHVTLAFLGEVPAARVAAASAAARQVAFGAFPLRLDCAGSFRGARVGWAGCGAPDPRLIALQGELAARLREAGFALEERPFAPHATLARHIGQAIERFAVDPVAWNVDGFRLVRSEAGTGRYSVLETFAAR